MVWASFGLATAHRAGYHEGLASAIDIEFDFIRALVIGPFGGAVPEWIGVFAGRKLVPVIRLQPDDVDILPVVMFDRPLARE